MAAYRGGVARRAHDREGKDDEAPVYLVTSARPGHSEEMSGRLRRYLISMTIRVICLVLAIFVLSGWPRLIGIAAAVVLPWIAVVMANAGPTNDGEQATFVESERTGIDGPPTIQIGPTSKDSE
jgi:hypothetical protein